MKIRLLECPSCGASIKAKRNETMMTCPYCESTVIIHSKLSSPTPPVKVSTVMPPITFSTSSATRSCSRVIVPLVLSIVLGAGAVIFFAISSTQDGFEDISLGGILGESGPPVLFEFGGEGMGAGYFTDAECIGLDSDGNIYIGEFDTGRVQVFDENGEYVLQWEYGKSDNIYLNSMAVSRSGELYLVYDSELHIHDGLTGDIIGTLEHPDGWGFDDVYVCDNGSVLASWYKNRDDIIRFSPDGRIDLMLQDAISGQTGDSELETYITADGMGNIFAYGFFNGSVFKFSEDGRFLTRFGSDGDRPGQFSSPSCIFTDPQGRLWVSDFGDLKIFDNNGLYLGIVDSGYYFSDMVMNSNFILYGLTNDNTVVVLDLSEYVEEL